MRIAVATWDIQGSDPEYITKNSIKSWLYEWIKTYNSKAADKGKTHKGDVDIYAIGIQSILTLTKQVENILLTWSKRLLAVINEFESPATYQLYGTTVSDGNALFLIAQAELLRSQMFRNESADYVRLSTQPPLVFQNPNDTPGAVGIRVDIGSTSMAFVSAFLQQLPGPEACAAKNAQYMQIANTMFQSQGRSLDEHDYVFWMGDFNYRICPQAAGIMNPDQMSDLIKRKNLMTLLSGDELVAQKQAGLVFQGYQEGLPNFPPTFIPSKNRPADVPGWADRVLWRKKNGQNGDHGLLIAYHSADIRISEHRPVVAVIDIPAAFNMSVAAPMSAFAGNYGNLTAPQTVYNPVVINGRQLSPGPIRRVMQPTTDPVTTNALVQLPNFPVNNVAPSTVNTGNIWVLPNDPVLQLLPSPQQTSTTLNVPYTQQAITVRPAAPISPQPMQQMLPAQVNVYQTIPSTSVQTLNAAQAFLPPYRQSVTEKAATSLYPSLLELPQTNNVQSYSTSFPNMQQLSQANAEIASEIRQVATPLQFTMQNKRALGRQAYIVDESECESDDNYVHSRRWYSSHGEVQDNRGADTEAGSKPKQSRNMLRQGEVVGKNRENPTAGDKPKTSRNALRQGEVLGLINDVLDAEEKLSRVRYLLTQGEVIGNEENFQAGAKPKMSRNALRQGEVMGNNQNIPKAGDPSKFKRNSLTQGAAEMVYVMPPQMSSNYNWFSSMGPEVAQYPTYPYHGDHSRMPGVMVPGSMQCMPY